MPTATDELILDPGRWPIAGLRVLLRDEPLPPVTGYLEREAPTTVELDRGGYVEYDSPGEVLRAGWEVA